MWLFWLTIFVILALAVLAVHALRRRGPAQNWDGRLAGEGQEAVLAGLHQRVVELRSMPSLFRDDDYRWLRERGQPDLARLLRRQRVALAGEYLLALKELFEEIHALHAHLAPGAESDLTAATALRFRLRWIAVRLLLPFSRVRLNLGRLEALGQALDGSFAGLERRAAGAPAGS